MPIKSKRFKKLEQILAVAIKREAETLRAVDSTVFIPSDYSR